MKRIRGRLTYANVISTLALFLVLGGGAAIAATELEPNSVATVHIQPQAVTGVKIKAGAVISSRLADEAVTDGKIASGAVTTGKIADGSVTAAKLDPGLGGARVVERIRGTAVAQFPQSASPPPAAVPYPLDNPTFIHPVGEHHQYIGSFQVRFPAGCGGRRSARAQLRINPTQRVGTFPETVGEGVIEDEGPAEATIVGQFSPSDSRGNLTAAPPSPTERTFSVALLSAFCANGATGVTMTDAKIDVIGIR